MLRRELPVSTAELLLPADPEHRPALIERAIAKQWDQLRVRDELQSIQSRLSELNQPPSAKPAARRSDTSRANVVQMASRPPIFTRQIQQFYRTTLTIHTEDLTSANRSALRTLFKALVVLARAQTTPRAPVFSPVPTVKGSGRKQTRTSAATSPQKQQR